LNILFIWFGLVEPLYKWRDICISQALELYPDAHFQCITTLKDFYGMEIIDARTVISMMEKQGYYSDIKCFQAMSDEMRFWWLMNNKNTLYMDTDTWCIKPMLPTLAAGKAGIEALWSGGESEPFSHILKIRKKGDIFIELEPQVKAQDLTEYFEHKPLWAKQIRQNLYPKKGARAPVLPENLSDHLAVIDHQSKEISRKYNELWNAAKGVIAESEAKDNIIRGFKTPK